jgi:hypothetical protein
MDLHDISNAMTTAFEHHNQSLERHTGRLVRNMCLGRHPFHGLSSENKSTRGNLRSPLWENHIHPDLKLARSVHYQATYLHEAHQWLNDSWSTIMMASHRVSGMLSVGH